MSNEYTPADANYNQKQSKNRFPNKTYRNKPENDQVAHNSRFQKPAYAKPYQKNNINTAMGDQLGRMRDNDQIDYIKRPPALMRGASSWEGDSIDHINVQNNAITPIGRFLAQNSNFAFRHSHYGDFASVESFNVWLTTVERDDRLRTCSGNEAHYHKRKLTNRPIANLRAILIDADYQKLKQYPEALAAFKESDLPFDNYFFERLADSRFPRRSVTGTWKIEGWEELRAAVKEEREPDLSRWLDVRGSGIFDFVLSDDGKKKTGPVAVDRIPTPKEFRNNIYRKNTTAPASRNVHSSIVKLENGVKSVDLETNQSLKNRVHVVALDAPTAEQSTAHKKSNDTFVVNLEANTSTAPEVNSIEQDSENNTDVVVIDNVVSDGVFESSTDTSSTCHDLTPVIIEEEISIALPVLSEVIEKTSAENIDAFNTSMGFALMAAMKNKSS